MTETLPPVRTTHQMRLPGGRWSYDLWGQHGRPVVFIPAVLFDRVSWWPVAADLRPYATVVAVDLPGHGGSERRERYEPEELVDDLACLVDSLQVRRAPVIVGHGPSALLATLFAARYATHAVVAVDPVPPQLTASGVEAYLQAMGATAIPEQYRSMVETCGDRRLLHAYAAGLSRLRPSAVTTAPTRLAVHSQPPEPHGAVPGSDQRWRHEIYDVPGRVAHLSAAHRFVSEVRALL